uniref:Uncharacterized protein n=1 Tax=Anguilla anguilla TaxID=7936 RepID=A0A0E9QSM9_ANGAN
MCHGSVFLFRSFLFGPPNGCTSQFCISVRCLIGFPCVKCIIVFYYCLLLFNHCFCLCLVIPSLSFDYVLSSPVSGLFKSFVSLTRVLVPCVSDCMYLPTCVLPARIRSCLCFALPVFCSV